MIFTRDGSPHYWYKFMYRGKLYSKSTKQGNRKVAVAIEAARRSEIAKGEFGIYDVKAAPTLEEFCNNIFEPEISATVGGNITAKTWNDFYIPGIKALKSYVPIASAPLDEITAELIGKFKVYRRNLGQSQDSSKPECEISTVNASVRVLRRILNYAASKHQPSKGLFLLAKAPEFDLMSGENKRERVITLKEEKVYLEKAAKQSSLLVDFTSVLFDTALRPDEDYRLEWDRILWETDHQDESSLRIIRGKTDNARRDVPLSPRVKAILTRRWKEAGKPSKGWVWPAPTASGHIEPSTLKKQHAKACKEAKIDPPFVLYDIRHTSLTRLGYSGCDPWTFARLAGHGNIQMSMRYVHPDQSENGVGWWRDWWRARNRPSKNLAGSKQRHLHAQGRH
ncbi:MAG TPA: site-specific integrase [Terriglobales bacterium]|nr:site-specific integrase [Terriglobales bacterium]